MSNDFKDAFNSVTAKIAQNADETRIALENHLELVQREYPRVCEILAIKVKDFFDGVNGSTVTITESDSDIEHFDGQKVICIGKARVKTTTLKYNGKAISFVPAGVNIMGFKGKIDVRTNQRNPFPKEAIFLVAQKTNEEEWTLATIDPQNRPIAMDDELLKDLLKQALL